MPHIECDALTDQSLSYICADSQHHTQSQCGVQHKFLGLLTAWKVSLCLAFKGAICSLCMQPITIMRNSLGPDEGGSGVPLDRQKYEESAAYWSERAAILSGSKSSGE